MFTKNGLPLGKLPFESKGVIYPSVGMRTPGEVLHVNFGIQGLLQGSTPFVFDIEDYVLTEISNVRARIVEPASALTAEFTDVPFLILLYALYMGYDDTAQALMSSLSLASLDNSSIVACNNAGDDSKHGLLDTLFRTLPLRRRLCFIQWL